MFTEPLSFILFSVQRMRKFFPTKKKQINFQKKKRNNASSNFGEILMDSIEFLEAKFSKFE